MKEMLKRFSIFCMAIIMCLSTSVAAFAAEETYDEKMIIAESEISTSSLGNLLAVGGINDLRYSSSCTINLSSSNLNTDFVITVHDNPNANYLITLITPSGSSKTALVGGDGGSVTFTLTYAKAGDYKVSVTRNSGTNNYAYAVVQVFD